MTKSEIRKDMLAKRRAKNKEFVDKNSELIYNKVVHDQWFINAKTVFIYVSFENEVLTSEIINYALESNKIVCVPFINSDNIMNAVRIVSVDELVVGKYGILAPESDLFKVKNKNIDLALVPVVAATYGGDRIGFGAGYYDRFLSDCNAFTIGLCYEFQIVENYAGEKRDVKLMKIINEKHGE